MELPYVLECAVTSAPDPIRGQVVKASIVLTKGTQGTEALKKEIQTYVSRVDDVIKSSGYRIGPFEIESVIMELPYVLECGVSAAPD